MARSNERFRLRILEKAEEMSAVEKLQQIVWPGDNLEIVPGHLLITAAHNGGLIVGAYSVNNPEGDIDAIQLKSDPAQDDLQSTNFLVGFVFGFPGFYDTPDGPRLKHCSHMLAVHPAMRDKGLGFALKRAQWQMVRRQGIDRITWTYDPLISRNAHLNITRLGAVCNTYIQDAYGQMYDELNIGLPSDRFQVDWWINSQRVNSRLSKRPRLRLDLAHFLAAETTIVNPTEINPAGLPRPADLGQHSDLKFDGESQPLLLVEIPYDFIAIKSVDMNLAVAWRDHTRMLFQSLFTSGFIITDFIYLAGTYPRSFYVLSYGEQTL